MKTTNIISRGIKEKIDLSPAIFYTNKLNKTINANLTLKKMLQEEGIVIFVTENITKVQAKERASCSSCSAHKFCGEGSGGSRIIETTNHIGAKVGQKVKIEIDSSGMLKRSLIIFLIPTILLIAGSLAGYLMGTIYSNEETAEMIGLGSGGISFFISFFIVKLINKKMDKNSKLYPEIVEILY